MAVNYDVYGQPTSWSNAFFQQSEITNKNKLASFGTGAKTLSEGVTAGKLSYSTPIDKSLSYCGLGKESAMSHVVYCGLHDNAFQAYDSTDREVTNFAFFEKQTNTDYLSQGNIWLNQLDRVDWSENIDTEWNYTQDLIPYTVINPHNIILVIYVSVSHGDGAYYDMTLEYFVRTFSQYNWTRISRVKIVPYFGNNTDDVAWSASAGYNPTPQGHSIHMDILDEYVVSAKNKRFYMYENPSFEWIPFGFVGANDIGSLTDTNLVYMCYIPESAKNHIKYDNTNREFYIEYYDDIVEDILKTVACFGLYFSTTTDDLGNLTNQNTYIGLLDSDGIGHGDYLQGADSVRAPQAADDFTDMFNSGYDPSKPYIEYDTTSHYGSLSYHNFNKMYSLTNTQVETLQNKLTAAMVAKPSNMSELDYSTGTFLTNNPIDCIISLRKYPIVNTNRDSTNHTVYFGGYQSDITAPYAKGYQIIEYNFTGSKAFVSEFGGSFLDKEGYTSAELFIPFCGNIKIPVDEFIDNDLSVKLVVDYLTGSCTAYIELNGIPRLTLNGDIGVDIPVTGVQTQTLANTIMRNNANLKTAQINAGMTARSGASIASGSGSATGALMSVLNMVNPVAIANKTDSTEKALITRDVAEYNLYHTEIPFKSVSAGDPVTAGCGEWRCRLSITRPVISPDYDPEIYAKTIGFACLKQGKIKKDGVMQFTGLTIGTIDLAGVNCTSKEKEMIMQAFKSGVYL